MTALSKLAAMSFAARGDCYLSLSGANLLLSRKNGNLLTINGQPYVIPAAGVTLAPTGAVAATFYYIYAAMVAGVMTLEYSTTGHSQDANTGVEIKTGDATRTLVGAAYCVTAGTWTDSASICYVLSHFNRGPKLISVKNSAGQSTVPTAWTTLNGIAWQDELVIVSAVGTGNISVANSTATVSLRLNAVALGFDLLSSQSIAGYQFPVGASRPTKVPASAPYSADVYGSANNSAILTMNIEQCCVTQG